jgi:hypothetical protein
MDFTRSVGALRVVVLARPGLWGRLQWNESAVEIKPISCPSAPITNSFSGDGLIDKDHALQVWPQGPVIH